MLASYFLFDTGPIVVLITVLILALLLLAIARRTADLANREICLIFGVVFLFLGPAASLTKAHTDAEKQQARQMTPAAMQEMSKENLPAGYHLDMWRRKIKLQLGTLACPFSFDVKRAYGHDPDGYKLRWRPVTHAGNGEAVGLSGADLASLAAACNR